MEEDDRLRSNEENDNVRRSSIADSIALIYVKETFTNFSYLLSFRDLVSTLPANDGSKFGSVQVWVLLLNGIR